MPLTTLDERTALVIVDLQNGILARPVTPHTANDVIARAVELADAFRTRGLPVALARFTTAADGSDATPGRTDLSRQARALPEGWDAIVDDVAGHPEDIIVTKRNWGSFHGTAAEIIELLAKTRN